MTQPKQTGVLSRSVAVLAGAMLVAGVAFGLAALARSSEARGGAAAPKATPKASNPQPSNPNRVLGTRLFDECIRWVARGQRGITRTTDFHIAVIAELDLDTARHRGPMRLWWKSPDKYRQEMTTGRRTTTKLLSGNSMWILHPTGKVQRLHGTSEGATAIKQLKEDRSRMADLAQFITLQSLKGPGVTFDFVKPTTGTGTFVGNWLKVVRRARGAANMSFWLAYDKDRQGRYVAKWPGIVSIDGDPRKRIPTEYFVLRSWADAPANQPRSFRYPRVIEAYSKAGKGGLVRFLKADVQDIKINTGIPDGRFQPPVPKGR